MQLHGSLQDLRQGDESVTQFMQKAKAFFDELVVVGRPVSLEDFNLYVFRGFRGEFKDLIKGLVTKDEPLRYANLPNHFLKHEFIHKLSHPSMGSAAINAPLLPTPNTPPSTFVSQRQSFGNFDRNRGRFHGGWRSNQFSNKGNRSKATDLQRPDQISAASTAPPPVTINKVIGRATGQNPHCQLCQTFGHTAPHYPQLHHRGYWTEA
jgi:hypothetical protein